MDNQNVTRSDAIARLNLARIGSLVKPNGSKLTIDNLDYLNTLRSALYGFTNEVEFEIDRIASAESNRISQREANEQQICNECQS